MRDGLAEFFLISVSSTHPKLPFVIINAAENLVTVGEQDRKRGVG